MFAMSEQAVFVCSIQNSAQTDEKFSKWKNVLQK